jgi:transcription termination factor Rho
MYEKSHSGIFGNQSGWIRFSAHQQFLCQVTTISMFPSQIRKYKLRTGDLVQGRIRISNENERYDALLLRDK